MKIYKNKSGIEGLYYIPNYLKQEKITNLINKINYDIKFESISKHKNSRRVAHYGYYYSYDRTGLRPAPKIPDFLQELISNEMFKKINKKYNIVNYDFDQVIINEYLPGQQINYHIDHTTLFSDVIVCITIGSSVPINFKWENEIVSVDVASGSMYIMTDDARYKWQHSLINNSDKTRYSITFRKCLNN